MRVFKLALARAAGAATWRMHAQHCTTASRIPVLCYHRVLPELVEGRNPVYSVTPAQFTEHMMWLAERSFRSLTLKEYAEIAAGMSAIPERAILITFDDGFADNYKIAYPIASRHGMNINVFVCTGLIEEEAVAIYPHVDRQVRQHRDRYPALWRPLTWTEVRHMLESGIGIGFHSHFHRNMGRLSAEDVHADVRRGLMLFKTHLGMLPEAFAFPKGTGAPIIPVLYQSCGVKD